MRTIIQSGGPFEEVYGYARAVRVGNVVAVSGSCCTPAAKDGDAYAQAIDALGVIAAALEQAGASIGDVVRTVTYVTDIADMPLIAKAHSEVFGDIRPAATIVEVATLADPAYLVEIQADAVVDA